MIPSQMLKGTLENCILKVISKKETYGYEISEELKKYGFADISEGTIYPMLLRLEKKGFIGEKGITSRTQKKVFYYNARRRKGMRTVLFKLDRAISSHRKNIQRRGRKVLFTVNFFLH